MELHHVHLAEFLADLKTLRDIVKAKLKRETQQDDKTMIMERTIQLVSMMPNKSKRQEILTNSFIDKLWNSLDHPPLLYMGDEYKYRQPDGSNNVRDLMFNNTIFLSTNIML